MLTTMANQKRTQGTKSGWGFDLIDLENSDNVFSLEEESNGSSALFAFTPSPPKTLHDIKSSPGPSGTTPPGPKLEHAESPLLVASRPPRSPARHVLSKGTGDALSTLDHNVVCAARLDESSRPKARRFNALGSMAWNKDIQISEAFPGLLEEDSKVEGMNFSAPPRISRRPPALENIPIPGIQLGNLTSTGLQDPVNTSKSPALHGRKNFVQQVRDLRGSMVFNPEFLAGQGLLDAGELEEQSAKQAPCAPLSSSLQEVESFSLQEVEKLTPVADRHHAHRGENDRASLEASVQLCPERQEINSPHMSPQKGTAHMEGALTSSPKIARSTRKKQHDLRRSLAFDAFKQPGVLADGDLQEINKGFTPQKPVIRLTDTTPTLLSSPSDTQPPQSRVTNDMAQADVVEVRVTTFSNSDEHSRSLASAFNGVDTAEKEDENTRVETPAAPQNVPADELKDDKEQKEKEKGEISAPPVRNARSTRSFQRPEPSKLKIEAAQKAGTQLRLPGSFSSKPSARPSQQELQRPTPRQPEDSARQPLQQRQSRYKLPSTGSPPNAPLSHQHPKPKGDRTGDTAQSAIPTRAVTGRVSRVVGRLAVGETMHGTRGGFGNGPGDSSGKDDLMRGKVKGVGSKEEHPRPTRVPRTGTDEAAIRSKDGATQARDMTGARPANQNLHARRADSGSRPPVRSASAGPGAAAAEKGEERSAEESELPWRHSSWSGPSRRISGSSDGSTVCREEGEGRVSNHAPNKLPSRPGGQARSIATQAAASRGTNVGSGLPGAKPQVPPGVQVQAKSDKTVRGPGSSKIPSVRSSVSLKREMPRASAFGGSVSQKGAMAPRAERPGSVSSQSRFGFKRSTSQPRKEVERQNHAPSQDLQNEVRIPGGRDDTNGRRDGDVKDVRAGGEQGEKMSPSPSGRSSNSSTSGIEVEHRGEAHRPPGLQPPSAKYQPLRHQRKGSDTTNELPGSHSHDHNIPARQPHEGANTAQSVQMETHSAREAPAQSPSVAPQQRTNGTSELRGIVPMARSSALEEAFAIATGKQDVQEASGEAKLSLRRSALEEAIAIATGKAPPPVTPHSRIAPMESPRYSSLPRTPGWLNGLSGIPPPSPRSSFFSDGAPSLQVPNASSTGSLTRSLSLLQTPTGAHLNHGSRTPFGQAAGGVEVSPGACASKIPTPSQPGTAAGKARSILRLSLGGALYGEAKEREGSPGSPHWGSPRALAQLGVVSPGSAAAQSFGWSGRSSARGARQSPRDPASRLGLSPLVTPGRAAHQKTSYSPAAASERGGQGADLAGSDRGASQQTVEGNDVAEGRRSAAPSQAGQQVYGDNNSDIKGGGRPIEAKDGRDLCKDSSHMSEEGVDEAVRVKREDQSSCEPEESDGDISSIPGSGGGLKLEQQPNVDTRGAAMPKRSVGTTEPSSRMVMTALTDVDVGQKVEGAAKIAAEEQLDGVLREPQELESTEQVQCGVRAGSAEVGHATDAHSCSHAGEPESAAASAPGLLLLSAPASAGPSEEANGDAMAAIACSPRPFDVTSPDVLVPFGTEATALPGELEPSPDEVSVRATEIDSCPRPESPDEGASTSLWVVASTESIVKPLIGETSEVLMQSGSPPKIEAVLECTAVSIRAGDEEPKVETLSETSCRVAEEPNLDLRGAAPSSRFEQAVQENAVSDTSPVASSGTNASPNGDANSADSQAMPSPIHVPHSMATSSALRESLKMLNPESTEQAGGNPVQREEKDKALAGEGETVSGAAWSCVGDTEVHQDAEVKEELDFGMAASPTVTPPLVFTSAPSRTPVSGRVHLRCTEESTQAGGSSLQDLRHCLEREKLTLRSDVSTAVQREYVDEETTNSRGHKLPSPAMTNSPLIPHGPQGSVSPHEPVASRTELLEHTGHTSPLPPPGPGQPSPSVCGSPEILRESMASSPAVCASPLVALGLKLPSPSAWVSPFGAQENKLPTPASHASPPTPPFDGRLPSLGVRMSPLTPAENDQLLPTLASPLSFQHSKLASPALCTSPLIFQSAAEGLSVYSPEPPSDTTSVKASNSRKGGVTSLANARGLKLHPLECGHGIRGAKRDLGGLGSVGSSAWQQLVRSSVDQSPLAGSLWQKLSDLERHVVEGPNQRKPSQEGVSKADSNGKRSNPAVLDGSEREALAQAVTEEQEGKATGNEVKPSHRYVAGSSSALTSRSVPASMEDAAVDSDFLQLLLAAEAAGLASLEIKGGKVKNSPPSECGRTKRPSRWSPVRKPGQYGPFDCTKQSGKGL